MASELSLLKVGTLGEINIGAQLAATALLPLLGQLDLLLGAQFGLGQLIADLQAQLSAALNFNAQLVLPQLGLEAALSGALAAVALLQAQISAGLSPPTFTISLAANLKLIAELQVRLGGIQALLDLSLGIKLQGLNVQAALALALGVGPVALYGATGQPLAALLSQISSRDYQADAGIAPGDVVDALLLVSKAPGFYAAASVLFVMPPA